MRLQGRNEKRVTMAIPVCLVTAEELPIADQAITVNVSPHGARVTTKRRWQLQEQTRVASTSGEFQGHARVVYCEPLADGLFCIGLRFHSPIADWTPVRDKDYVRTPTLVPEMRR
jgi:ubiquinone/menaquinone biosynthesis C-methylase UbiE